MLILSVLDHGIRDSFFVFTGELGAATRTLLRETHRAKSRRGRLWS
jgi:hypothetical protein